MSKEIPDNLIPYWMKNEESKNELVKFLKKQHDETVTEIFAEVAHSIWAHWMRYMFSVCQTSPNGNVMIPDELYTRWMRQLNTHYVDLTEKEKQSDRNVAEQFIIPKVNEIVE